MEQILNRIDRRGFCVASAGGMIALAAPSVLRVQDSAPVRRNASSFRLHEWQDHFDIRGKGNLLSDTRTRVLQRWPRDGEMRVYPTSVPLSDELTRRGYTEAVFKDTAPDWAPTPSMLQRDPSLSRSVGPGPDNLFGIRALHLSWQYYRIHGTNDTRKIGRKSSNRCIGLCNEQIVEVFGRTPVGTQVKLI